MKPERTKLSGIISLCLLLIFTVNMVKAQGIIKPLQPSNGATNVNVAVLKWSGQAGCLYDIYFGPNTTPQIYKKAVSETELKPVILELNRKYYWKVVAKKEGKTVDSSALFSFSTLPVELNNKVQYKPLVDNRDDKVYWTTVIADNEWFAQNLDFKISGNSFYYENNEANKVYGQLYSGTLFSESETNVCPEGWHVPSRQEWTDMIGSLGGIKTAAPALREASSKFWRTSSVAGNNGSGMTILPAGSRDSKPSFSNMGKYTFFWTSTPNKEISGSFYAFNLGFMRANLVVDTGDKNWSYSVRCIKDK